jgi:radical SAM protein with 4Fe4S-binding SPASM domain
MTKVFCTAPWTGLTIREDGHVRTCCVGDTSLGNLNEAGIQEILKSQSLKEIQQNMLSGKPDQKNCQTCIQSETQSGLATLKEHYNLFYPDFVKDQLNLKCLDIRWNNACNLGCVYCNPTFSSVWQDRLNIKRSLVVKPYQDDLLQWILSRSTEIDEIMLVGGEPMLMKQNYKLINDLSDQCKISIITNLSYNLSELPCTPRLLSRPRSNTKWNVSLENTGAKFEYVRNMGKWSLIEDNLQYLVQHWPNTVSINFVYSMFSAFDIVETIKTFHQAGIKKINMFPINNNYSMDVFNMPESIRKKAAYELKAASEWHFENLHPEDRDFYPIQGIDATFNQLTKSKEPALVTLKMFNDQIIQYDQYNHQKFQDLWPNIIDLVEEYL